MFLDKYLPDSIVNKVPEKPLTITDKLPSNSDIDTKHKELDLSRHPFIKSIVDGQGEFPKKIDPILKNSFEQIRRLNKETSFTIHTDPNNKVLFQEIAQLGQESQTKNNFIPFDNRPLIEVHNHPGNYAHFSGVDLVAFLNSTSKAEVVVSNIGTTIMVKTDHSNVSHNPFSGDPEINKHDLLSQQISEIKETWSTQVTDEANTEQRFDFAAKFAQKYGLKILFVKKGEDKLYDVTYMDSQK